MAELSRSLSFSVRRSEPRSGFERFAVPYRPGMTVLEALMEAYRTDAPDLAFRHSCGSGRCYCCLVLMNRRPVVACREPLADGALLEPLPNRRVIRDLVVEHKKL